MLSPELSAGNLARYTDADGRVQTFQYNSADQLACETWYNNAADANAGQEAVETINYAYDSSGRLVSEGDAGSSIAYTYDSQGREATQTESSVGGPTVVLSFQYNAQGLLSTESAGIDGTPDFLDSLHYDGQGRVVSISQTGQPGGDAVTPVEVDFTYNSLQDEVTLDRYQNGQFVAQSVYQYNNLGELVSLVHSQGANTLASYSYSYSNGGGVSLPNATLLTLSGLSALGGQSVSPAVSDVPVHDTTGIPAALLSAADSGESLLTACTSIDGTAQYSYDSTGQLTAATYTAATGSASALAANESYSYDANGNRTNSGDVIGPNNELLSDGTYAYQYDADGNLIQRTTIATGAVTDYTWDARNRLVTVTDYATAGGVPTETVTYVYDVENRWIGETVTAGGTTTQTRYVYDGNQIVMQFQGTGSGNLTATNLSHRYLWGPAVDQLLADEQLAPVTGGGYDLTSPGTTVWTLTDNENTVRDLATYSNGTTTVENHREFSAYGELLSQTNPQTGQAAAVDCVFAYTGRALDEATGLQNNAERWYEAITGRWLSQDPIRFGGGDANLYRYVDNSPVSDADPTGTTSSPWPLRPPPKEPTPQTPQPWAPQGPLPPQPPAPVPMPIPPRPWGPWPWWPWYPNWLPPPPRPRIQLTPGGPKVPIPPPPPPPDNQNNLPNRGLTGCPCPWTIA